jgi:hypothetical protein
MSKMLPKYRSREEQVRSWDHPKNVVIVNSVGNTVLEIRNTVGYYGVYAICDVDV